MRLLSTAIAPVTAMIVLVFAPYAADAQNARLADDIALTKSTVSLLAAKDIAAVRERLDPSIGAVSDDTLRKMSDVVSAGEPVSIETIRANETHEVKTGDGSSRILLEYGWPGKWLVVDATIRTQGDTKRLRGLFLTSNALPLRELNAFHLFGKGAAQYLFLLGWLVTIALTVWAMVMAFKRHAGWRKWAFMAAMPLGLTPTVAMNWNTAHWWVMEATSNAAGQTIPIVAFRYPMALFGQTEMLVTYLYISAPLFALGYLIWQWRKPAAAGETESSVV